MKELVEVVAKAIRTVVKAASSKDDTRVDVEIV